jgi:hypothetical protein
MAGGGLLASRGGAGVSAGLSRAGLVEPSFTERRSSGWLTVDHLPEPFIRIDVER